MTALHVLTLAPRYKTIVDDLRLSPQARRVLAHLESGESISQMEALTVYSIFRLASRISELRSAGYDIHREMKEDNAGHRYARYWLG